MHLNFGTVSCPHCDGQGSIGDGPRAYLCTRCKGSGRVLECTVCSGKGSGDTFEPESGKCLRDFWTCDHCNGTGAEPEGGDDA